MQGVVDAGSRKPLRFDHEVSVGVAAYAVNPVGALDAEVGGGNLLFSFNNAVDAAVRDKKRSL